VQRRFSKQRDEQQRRDAGPRDQMKSVDERQRVRLQSNTRSDQSDGAARRGGESGGFRIQSRGELPERGVVDPVALLDVKTEKVGVQLFPHSDEVRHERDSELAAKETDGVKEGGKTLAQPAVWKARP